MKLDYSNFFTTQHGPAQNLQAIVARHALSRYRRPIAQHQYAAWQILIDFTQKRPKPIILDSCCGTGLSTSMLAQRFPEHWVVGIDKSAARLSRNTQQLPTNCLLLRADVIDLWRIINDKKLPITHHFLFYPNPWPKARHIKRRFHAHPVFSDMVRLAPYFELRTNWRIYAEECAIALTTLGQKATVELKTDNAFISLFEKKYIQNSCPIFTVKSQQKSLVY